MVGQDVAAAANHTESCHELSASAEHIKVMAHKVASSKDNVNGLDLEQRVEQPNPQLDSVV